ncbi:hypothetical protein [Streptomyces sp. NPDC047079]|uniref:hypothetical protein n=1 Tax=Streptomyces sp. NPDC047079 TaxID=3154607 RepID=UPI0033E69FE8
MTTNLNKQGFDGPVAWDTARTRSALLRWTLWHLAKFLGWVALWWGALYVTVVLLPVGAVVFMVVVLCAFAVLARLALARLWRFRRMRRVLQVYPWRQQSSAVRLTKGKEPVFVLPNPDRPGETVSLKGTVRWVSAARKGFDGDVWYAGDPRFACVIAKPDLTAVSYAAQPTAYDSRTSPRRKGVSPEARRRARAIGARVAD